MFENLKLLRTALLEIAEAIHRKASVEEEHVFLRKEEFTQRKESMIQSKRYNDINLEFLEIKQREEEQNMKMRKESMKADLRNSHLLTNIESSLEEVKGFMEDFYAGNESPVDHPSNNDIENIKFAIGVLEDIIEDDDSSYDGQDVIEMIQDRLLHLEQILENMTGVPRGSALEIHETLNIPNGKTPSPRRLPPPPPRLVTSTAPSIPILKNQMRNRVISK
jgi:hypothetical protein